MSPRKRHATLPNRANHYMKVGSKPGRRAGTLPPNSSASPPEEEEVKTFINPLHRKSNLSASSPAKRSTITNGDAVQQELLEASKKIQRKSKSNRFAAVLDEGVRKSPSMSFVNDADNPELSPRKQRALTFQDSADVSSSRSSSSSRITRDSTASATTDSASGTPSPTSTSTSTLPATASPKKQTLKRSLSVENLKNALLKKSSSSSSQSSQDA
jgi:hypothetical protein